jgi:hypothetical protein
MGLSQISVNEFMVRKALIFQRLLACAKQSNLNPRMGRFCPEIRLEKRLATGFPSPLAGRIPLGVIWVTNPYRKPADKEGFGRFSLDDLQHLRHGNSTTLGNLLSAGKTASAARQRLEGIMIPPAA